MNIYKTTLLILLMAGGTLGAFSQEESPWSLKNV